MISVVELGILHLVLPFIVGGAWITIVTVVADRSGRVLSSLLAGIPSTAAFSFLFIGINQSPVVASQGTTDYPLFFSFTASFTLFYSLFSRKVGCVYGLLSSLSIWLVLTFVIVRLGIRNFSIGLSTVVVVSLVTYALLARTERAFDNLEETSSSSTHYSWTEITVRALISGSIVDSAVLMSQVAGSIFGAMFSSFPAILTSTFYLTNRSRGLNFSQSMAKPLMVSMVMAVIPYIVTIKYAYPVYGLATGTLIAYTITAPFVLASYLILIPKKDRIGFSKLLGHLTRIKRI